MTVDLYKPCPCGSGKKIKFCCRDLAQELERLMRMIEGDQRLAALDKIDSLLQKHPNHTALLVLKAEVRIQLKEFAEARKVVDQLHEIDPKNPGANALAVFLDLVDRKSPRELVDQLQEAIGNIDGVMSKMVYDAILAVAIRLYTSGFPVAAKGHLDYALALSKGKDQKCLEYFDMICRDERLPLLARQVMGFLDCPDNVTWRVEFQRAMSDAMQGRWAASGTVLSDMANRILDEAPILRNAAIVNSWLCENKLAAKLFRQYARLKRLDLDDRVEAEALAQILDPATTTIYSLRYTISDMDSVMEKCLSADNFHPISAADFEETPDGRPKAAFRVTLDGGDVPISLVVATVVLFAKRTDRDAFASVIANDGVDQAKQFCDGIFGTEATVSPDGDAISWLVYSTLGTPRLAEELPVDQRQQVIKDYAGRRIEGPWLDVPCPVLDGKSINQAKSESKYQVPILAMLLQLETNADDIISLDFNALREKLGLPVAGPINVADTPLSKIPVCRLPRVDATQLSDQDLVIAYRRAIGFDYGPAIRMHAVEVVKRESLEDDIDKVQAYDILAAHSNNSDESLAYLEKARKLATAQGECPAPWLFQEIETRLLRNEVSKAEAIFREISDRYANEPGVMQMMVAFMQRHGMIDEHGRPRHAAPTEGLAAVASENPADSWSGIADAEPLEDAGAQEKSGLWLPGMD
ncbi:MAG: tetratricopeptide repeat protein [Pirellulaceae bacterium]